MCVAIPAWFIFRPTNDPRIVGPTPPGLKLVPRSLFNSKPLVNLPWFGGSRVKFPPTAELPAKWKDNPNASGYFTWALPAGHKGSATADTYANAAFAFSSWRDEAGTEHVIVADVRNPLPYVHCPSVFGTKRRSFDVTFSKSKALEVVLIPPPSFKIDLPPTGKPAPKLGFGRATIGHVTLEISPKEWIGPLFEPIFRVTAKGLAADERLLIDQSPDAGMFFASRSLELAPGKEGEILNCLENLSLEVSLAKVRQAPVTIKKVPSSTSSYDQYEIVDSEGKVVLTGYDSAGVANWTVSDSHVKIGDRWLAAPFNIRHPAEYWAILVDAFNARSPSTPPTVGRHDATTYYVKLEKIVTLKGMVPSGVFSPVE